MSRPPTILLTNRIHPAVQDLFAGEARFIVAQAPEPDAIRADAIDHQADAVIVRALLPDDLFDAAPALCAAVRHGAGIDMIPLQAAARCNVPVANVPGVNARSVAEHVAMQLIALARRNGPVRRDMARRDWWTARAHADSGVELLGRTVGLVGVGNVGQQVAAILHHGFGMRVIGTGPETDRWPPFVRPRDLEALLAESDALVLCCPLTERTRGLIDAAAIARMKPGAFLINVARGPVVVEDALVDALRKGKLGGAALDVYASHPLSSDHPFHDLPTLLLTPHIAGITDGSMRRMGEGAVTQALQILRGEKPPHLIDARVWDRRRRPSGR